METRKNKIPGIREYKQGRLAIQLTQKINEIYTTKMPVHKQDPFASW
jgi:hypothetical protein